MLPHFVRQDMEDVVEDLQTAGIPMKSEWYEPHMEFRFPEFGAVVQRRGSSWSCGTRWSRGTCWVKRLEAAEHRAASIPPWNGMQVHVDGMVDSRHVSTATATANPAPSDGGERAVRRRRAAPCVAAT